MTSFKKELLFMILKFLKQENLNETAHVLEHESGCFFDLQYFESLVHGGKFDEAEQYLSGFTHIHDNFDSTKIFFELRKQKFLEALDKNERAKAFDILMKDIKDFTQYNEGLLKDATFLLGIDDFRKCGALCNYRDIKTERILMMNALKRHFTNNPAFNSKLQIPITSKPNLLQLIMHGTEGSSSNALT